MDCPCGYHQMTEYDLIMCDGCNYYCHSNCVGLSEEDIEVIARDKPDWFCPKCLAEAARANDISSSFQNSKSEEDNYSADVPKPETIDSYHHEASPKETNSTLDLTAPLEVTSNIIVRPGKHWRRSLSANIHQSVLAASPAEHSLVNPSLQPSFAVPRIPGRSNVRRSSRMTRLRQGHMFSKSTRPPPSFFSSVFYPNNVIKFPSCLVKIRGNWKKNMRNASNIGIFFLVSNHGLLLYIMQTTMILLC